MPLSIPLEGERSDLILHQIREMKKEDVAWKDGRVWAWFIMPMKNTTGC